MKIVASEVEVELPLKATTELESKYRPETVSVNAGLPARMLFGIAELMIGGGCGSQPPRPKPQLALPAQLDNKAAATTAQKASQQSRRVIAFSSKGWTAQP